MKQHHPNARNIGTTRRAGGSHLALSLAIVGVAAVVEGSVFGLDQTLLTRDKPVPGAMIDPNEPPPPPPPVQAAPVGDETVGTLPVLAGGRAIALVRAADFENPGFFLEGRFEDVQNVLVAASGEVLAQVDLLDPIEHRVRLTFPGRVRLVLDRALVEATGIEFGLWVPQPSPYAYPIGVWGDRTTFFTSTTSRVDLPITPMSAVGALDLSPLAVQAFGASAATMLDVRTSPDLLVLSQSH